jgi:hypothetical protein
MIYIFYTYDLHTAFALAPAAWPPPLIRCAARLCCLMHGPLIPAGSHALALAPAARPATLHGPLDPHAAYATSTLPHTAQPMRGPLAPAARARMHCPLHGLQRCALAARPACVRCAAFSRTPARSYPLACTRSSSCASPGVTASCSSWHCLLIRCAAFSRPLHGQLAPARDAARCTYILYFWYIQCRSYFFQSTHT